MWLWRHCKLCTALNISADRNTEYMFIILGKNIERNSKKLVALWKNNNQLAKLHLGLAWIVYSITLASWGTIISWFCCFYKLTPDLVMISSPQVACPKASQHLCLSTWELYNRGLWSATLRIHISIIRRFRPIPGSRWNRFAAVQREEHAASDCHCLSVRGIEANDQVDWTDWQRLPPRESGLSSTAVLDLNQTHTLTWSRKRRWIIC